MTVLASWAERSPPIQQDLINCKLFEKIVRVYGAQPAAFARTGLIVFTNKMREAALNLAVCTTQGARVDATHQIA